MVAVSERYLKKPPAIDSPLHRMGGWIPAVEIAHQCDRFRFGSGIIEIDRLDQASVAGFSVSSIHVHRLVDDGSVTGRRGQSSFFSPTQTRKKCRTDPDAPSRTGYIGCCLCCRKKMLLAPAAAESLDELNGGDESLARELGAATLGLQFFAAGIHDFQVTHQ